MTESAARREGVRLAKALERVLSLGDGAAEEALRLAGEILGAPRLGPGEEPPPGAVLVDGDGDAWAPAGLPEEGLWRMLNDNGDPTGSGCEAATVARNYGPLRAMPPGWGR